MLEITNPRWHFLFVRLRSWHRMADVKPNPSASTTSQPSSTPSTSNQHSKVNQSSAPGSGEIKSGGRKRYEDGGYDNSGFYTNADDHSDSGSINRRGKRPEVQHYKPPGASKKPDDVNASGQDFDMNNQDETSKTGGGTNSIRRPYRGRGRRGGHNYHNQQQHYNAYNAQNDVDDASRKVKSMNIEDDYLKYEDNDGSFYKGNSGGRRKKKPEQLHYIPKKSTTGNDTSSGSLDRHWAKDNTLTGNKKEDEKSEGNTSTSRSKDNNPSISKKPTGAQNAEENIYKDEKFGTAKRNRNKMNKREHKKDFKDDKDHVEQLHQEKRHEKRESGGKLNMQPNTELKSGPKENGYVGTGGVFDATEKTVVSRGEKEGNKRYSTGTASNVHGNEHNLPPRLRGGDRTERPHTTENNDRGGRMGGRTGKGGIGKGGRWGGKHSRGNSPQGEATNATNDYGNGGIRAQNSKKEDIKAREENTQKYLDNKPQNDIKGHGSKNNNQNAFSGGYRASKNERDKDGRQHNHAVKSSLSFGSDLSRSSESFQQQHQEAHGAQSNTIRSKRNSVNYRGGQNFKAQSPSPVANNQQNTEAGHTRRNLSPKSHSHNQNLNMQENNESRSHRNEPSFHRNRISTDVDSQHGSYRRAGPVNRSGKDMSDWRSYREGSHHSVSSDYDNQYQQESRGGYNRANYDKDRSWETANYNNVGNQINPSHRDLDQRERIGGVNQGRQNLGRSNSAVFGGNAGNVKHSGSIPRTSIPPRFQKNKDSGHQPQDTGDNQHPRQNHTEGLSQQDPNFQGSLNSESDWGPWRETIPSQTRNISDESKEPNKDKLAIEAIQNDACGDSFNRIKDQSKPASTLENKKLPDTINKLSNEAEKKERIDSCTSDDFSSYSKVTDWSLEVEEEEEQQREQLLHQQKNFNELAKIGEQKSVSGEYPAIPNIGNVPHTVNQGSNTGGIIRLPSQQNSSTSASCNWRRDQIQNQGQENQDSQNVHSRHPTPADNQSQILHDSNNPAWRGISNPEILHLQQQQQIAAAIAARAAANAANRTGGNQQPYGGPHVQRYLFDHKNPNKPIHVGPSSNNPATVNPRLISNNGDLGMIPGARFALDPRFAHPPRAVLRHHNPSHESSSHQAMAHQHQYAQAYHPVTGQPLPVQQQGHFPSTYRPPFPNAFGSAGPRNNISGPPPGTPQIPQLSVKQGAPESGRNEWQHSGPISHPQMMQMEAKPDFETIKFNEMALFETSKLIVTNDFLLQGGQKLRRLWDNEVTQARRNILCAFQRLLQNDLVFCAEKDVEFLIWRICFYNLVETLKSMLKHSEQSLNALGGGGGVPPMGPCLTPEIKSMVEQIIRSLLDEGLEFYSYMLDTLDKIYHIGLDKYYDVLEPRSPDANMRCVLVSAQKCLLCLGDLARYKEQTQETSNYGKARQYYQKASHIDTRNGRPYNQLAILAYTTKRKFEAVYYNMRCLSCKSSVRSSQESLTVIFEDIAKKWEITEKRRLEDIEERKREADREKESARLIKGTRLRYNYQHL